MDRRVKITLGSLTAVGLAVSAGIGLNPNLEDIVAPKTERVMEDGVEVERQKEQQQFLIFTDRAEYETARNTLLDKWQNNEPINVISEYSVLVSMIDYEVKEAGGWEFDNKRDMKEQVLEKSRTQKEVTPEKPIEVPIIEPTR